MFKLCDNRRKKKKKKFALKKMKKKKNKKIYRIFKCLQTFMSHVSNFDSLVVLCFSILILNKTRNGSGQLWKLIWSELKFQIWLRWGYGPRQINSCLGRFSLNQPNLAWILQFESFHFPGQLPVSSPSFESLKKYLKRELVTPNQKFN